MSRFFLFVLYLKEFIIFISILVLVLLCFNIIMFPIIQKTDYEFIPWNLVYYEGDKLDEYILYAKEYNLSYNLTPTYYEKGKFDLQINDIIDPIYLYDLEYLKETTAELVESNLDTLNVDNEKYIKPSAQVSFFPQETNEYTTKNYTLGIDKILYGRYPKENQEVMVPEVYAIYLANELGVNSYKDLINHKIDLNLDNLGYLNQFTIVGIYAGGNDFIIYPSAQVYDDYKEYKYEGLFITFNTFREKYLFFKNLGSNDVVNTSDFILNYVLLSFDKILRVFVILVSVYFIWQKQKEYVKILNHNKYRFSNYIIPLIIPLLIVDILLLIFKN